jgi:hypothetical protein
MPRRSDRWLMSLVALATGLANPPSTGAGPVSGSTAPTATVPLAAGVTVHYAYHYDRNALTDILSDGDALLALTDSGNLLRFDRVNLGLTREWFGPSPAVCLGRGEGGAVLVGFADGRVGRVDPATLTVTEIARMPGKVQWVGMMPRVAGRPAKARVIAVVERTKWVKNDEGERVEVPFSVVHDSASGRSYAPDARSEIPDGLRASAFLLDRKNRLWLGADNGEWGGWCSSVDLEAGEIHSVPAAIDDRGRPSGWRGVVGFTELRDGQVWAFGGLTHMGSTEGFIWRVDRGKAEALHGLNNGPLIRRRMDEAEKAAGIAPRRTKSDPRPEPPFPADRPFLPITHVIEDAGTGVLVVVSFSDVYRTDARLARWEKTHELRVRYRWGRADAVGAYPSVRSVLALEEPGKPMGLLFATRLDGLIRLADGRETGRALSGQLGAEFVGRIEGSAEGVLFFDGDDPWRLRDGTWNTVSFAPPFEKDPREQVVQGVASGPTWSKTRVLIGRDEAIFTVNEGNITPGTRTTARWRNGRAEVLGRETSTFDASACFLTPDDQLWSADDGELRRFTGGRWLHAGGFDWPPEANSEEWRGIGWGLRVVDGAGPPWVRRDDINHILVRLTHGPDFKDPWLEAMLIREDRQARRLEVRDAIAWARGELLMATDRGLRTYAIDDDRLATPSLHTGGRAVSRLARDGRGRLWLGGEGLALLEADGKTLHPLDELPMLGRTKVVALAADPDHPDGVIAAVEGRGVVFVRVHGR